MQGVIDVNIGEDRKGRGGIVLTVIVEVLVLSLGLVGQSKQQKERHQQKVVGRRQGRQQHRGGDK